MGGVSWCLVCLCEGFVFLRGGGLYSLVFVCIFVARAHLRCLVRVFYLPLQKKSAWLELFMRVSSGLFAFSGVTVRD